MMASREEKQRRNYLDGVARRPHSHSRTLHRSLEGAGPSHSTDGASANPSLCPQCYPVLVHYIDLFKLMKHSVTELKKHNRVNPYPMKQDSEFQEWFQFSAFSRLPDGQACAIFGDRRPNQARPITGKS